MVTLLSVCHTVHTEDVSSYSLVLDQLMIAQLMFKQVLILFNLLTPMSDQNRISPHQNQYNFKHTSNENKEQDQLGDY